LSPYIASTAAAATATANRDRGDAVPDLLYYTQAARQETENGQMDGWLLSAAERTPRRMTERAVPSRIAGNFIDHRDITASRTWNERADDAGGGGRQ